MTGGAVVAGGAVVFGGDVVTGGQVTCDICKTLAASMKCNSVQQSLPDKLLHGLRETPTTVIGSDLHSLKSTDPRACHIRLTILIWHLLTQEKEVLFVNVSAL